MIRGATHTDAPRLAELNEVLGRHDRTIQISEALARSSSDEREAGLVFDSSSDGVPGCIHVAEREILGSGRCCESIGLVVDLTKTQRVYGKTLSPTPNRT